YRDANKPYFHDVQIKGGGDATSAARAVFQTGEVDYAWNLQVEAQVLNQLQQGGKANLVTALSPNVERLLVNFADPNAEGAKRSDGIRAKGGVRMHVVYQTTVNPLRQKEQDIVKSGWEKLGLEVELKSVDAGVFFSSDAGNPDTASHFFTDIEMFTNGASSPDQTQYVALWTTEQIVNKANQWHGNNYSHWSNADYDQIYNPLKTET